MGCSSPLQMWCLVEGCRLLASIFHSWQVQRDLERTETEIISWVHIGRLLSLFSYVWFVIGHVWFFQALDSPCAWSPVFNLTAALIILQYTLMLLPLIILLIITPCLCLCAPCLLHRYWNRDRSTEKGASRKQIGALPTQTYVKHRGTNLQGDQCAICLAVFNNKDTIRIMPCDHIHHKKCLDNWLLLQGTCPVCRYDITNESPVESSDDSIIEVQDEPEVVRSRQNPSHRSSLTRTVSDLSLDLTPRVQDETLSSLETAVAVSRRVAAPRFLFSLRRYFLRQSSHPDAIPEETSGVHMNNM